MGAGGPALARQAALDGVGTVVEGLPAAEHADQEVRRQHAGETGGEIDLVAIDRGGRGGSAKRRRRGPAVQRGAGNLGPAEPFPGLGRAQWLSLDRAGITKCGESVIGARSITVISARPAGTGQP